MHEPEAADLARRLSLHAASASHHGSQHGHAAPPSAGGPCRPRSTGRQWTRRAVRRSGRVRGDGEHGGHAVLTEARRLVRVVQRVQSVLHLCCTGHLRMRSLDEEDVGVLQRTKRWLARRRGDAPECPRSRRTRRTGRTGCDAGPPRTRARKRRTRSSRTPSRAARRRETRRPRPTSPGIRGCCRPIRARRRPTSRRRPPRTRGRPPYPMRFGMRPPRASRRTRAAALVPAHRRSANAFRVYAKRRAC